MDVHFIENRYKVKKIKNIDKLISVIPKKVCIVSTIQYIDIANIVRRELQQRGIKVYTQKSDNLKYEMQVTGCDVSAAAIDDIDTVIFIGDGEFHPKEIIRKLRKKVILYTPTTGDIKEISLSDKSILSLLGIFSSSERIGIVTSIKPGQFRIKEANILKKVLEKEGKRVYLFIGDNIPTNEADNYRIDFWIIAACPRIYEDFVKNKIPAISIDILTEYRHHHRLCKTPEKDTTKGCDNKEKNRGNY